MKSIKAVIFDMDGLMVDTEPLHLQAFNYALGKHGKYLTEEENTDRYIGVSDAEAAQDIAARFNLPISAAELVRIEHTKSRELYQTNLRPQKGLIGLLNDLKNAKYKIAIASGSDLKLIKTIIKNLKIERLIDQIASVEEVKNGKPAPDVFLKAAEKLDVNPSECLVLEDAPKGVQSGKAAGMRVFAIPSQYTKDQDFSLADKVVDSLSEVFELIRQHHTSDV